MRVKLLQDLYSAETKLIFPCYSAVIETEVGVSIPQGYFGKIHAQSSLAIRYTDVGGGVIDSGYRGPIRVVFFNHMDEYL